MPLAFPADAAERTCAARFLKRVADRDPRRLKGALHYIGHLLRLLRKALRKRRADGRNAGADGGEGGQLASCGGVKDAKRQTQVAGTGVGKGERARRHEAQCAAARRTRDGRRARRAGYEGVRDEPDFKDDWGERERASQRGIEGGTWATEARSPPLRAQRDALMTTSSGPVSASAPSMLARDASSAPSAPTSRRW